MNTFVKIEQKISLCMQILGETISLLRSEWELVNKEREYVRDQKQKIEQERKEISLFWENKRSRFNGYEKQSHNLVETSPAPAKRTKKLKHPNRANFDSDSDDNHSQNHNNHRKLMMKNQSMSSIPRRKEKIGRTYSDPRKTNDELLKTNLEKLLVDVKPIFTQIYNVVKQYEIAVANAKQNHSSNLEEPFFENCAKSVKNIQSSLTGCFKGKMTPQISMFIQNELIPMFNEIEKSLRNAQKNPTENLHKLDQGMHELTIFPRKLVWLIRTHYPAADTGKQQKDLYVVIEESERSNSSKSVPKARSKSITNKDQKVEVAPKRIKSLSTKSSKALGLNAKRIESNLPKSNEIELKKSNNNIIKSPNSSDSLTSSGSNDFGWKCLECSKINALMDKTCKKCGNQTSKSDSISCRNCNAENATGRNICQNCGTSLITKSAKSSKSSKSTTFKDSLGKWQCTLCDGWNEQYDINCGICGFNT
jgi:hypothetical protein